MQTSAIGIDLGGTKLAAAIVHADGTFEARTEIPTRDEPDDVRKDMVALIRQLKADAGSPQSLIGVGIGVAGQVDARRGFVRDAPNLDWHDVALVDDLKQDLKLPVTVTNDVRAATWGEWLFGAAKDCEDAMCVFVGTGIGAGIVSGGQMLSGAANSAGEVGHMTVDFDGEECRCGNRGCWETVAGGYWLGERTRRAIQADRPAGRLILQMVNDDLEEISGEEVVQAGQQGDPLALRMLEQTYVGLAAGAVSVVNAFNPQRLILGGGLIHGLPDALTRIEQGVRARALRAAVRHLEIVPAKLGNDAGLIGAAAFAMRKFG